MLYNDAFRKISFTMFGNFLAETYSPNILNGRVSYATKQFRTINTILI
jgi:hypothetical protein